MQGALHAREYTTAELVTRFAEQLVSGYGSDADITWLLDYHQIHIVPIANPDGRKFAEQGYSWRKNTNPTSTNPPLFPDPAPFPRYGVDLNRNYEFEWGNARLKDGTPAPFASSGNPAANTYRGESSFSEPESQALSAYVGSLFSYGTAPERIAGDPTAPVYRPEYADISDDMPGIYLDVHSAGNWVLYPWGWYEGLVAPNNDQLRSLERKYGFFTGTVDAPFDVIRAEQLCPADGAIDDWVFGNFGVASYTLELGNTFFEPSAYFETTIAPENLPALLYMAKAARRPYQSPAGSDSLQVSVDFRQVVAGIPVTLSAVADDTRYDFQKRTSDDAIRDRPFDPISDAPEPVEAIANARYSINQPSWISGVQTAALSASDGSFDSTVEGLQAAINTANFAPGRYTIFVESQDAAGNWGVPTAVFLEVLASDNANVVLGTDGSDTLFGTAGADFLYGKGSGDQLFGSEGINLLNGGAGDDVLYGRSSADTLFGGAGDDRIFAAEGNNTIDAGDGNNTVYGGSGNDVITSGSGDDVIYAAEGNNTIDAGAGENVIYSGSGRDRFFLNLGSGSTRIVNFNPDQDRLVMQPGLSFSQFAVTPSSAGDRFTQIRFASTGDLVATLNDVNAA